MTQQLALKNFNIWNNGEPLFQPITMNADTGIHAICGVSGMGKSSLLLGIVDLLFHKNGPRSQGEIKLNGQCRSSFSPLEFRRRVCLLPQHPVMFVGSILDNLFIGAVPGAFPLP